MRSFFMLAIIVLVIAAVVGHRQGWFAITTATSNHGADVHVTVNKEQWHKDRDAFRQQTETQLKHMERQLEELKIKARQASPASQVQLNQEIDKLGHQCQEAKQQLEKLGEAAEEHWEAAKVKIAQAIEDWKSRYGKASER